MSPQVAVGHGLVATIDEADAALVGRYRWHVIPGKKTAYAATCINGKTVYMHRLLLGFPRLSVDHVNGDGLDNRRGNLREATVSQQGQNSRPKGGRSRFKGIYFHKASGLWAAMIELPGRKRLARYAKEEVAAARLYNELAREHFGEYAKLNVLEGAA